MDVFYLGIIFIGFILTWALLKLCESLMGEHS